MSTIVHQSFQIADPR